MDMYNTTIEALTHQYTTLEQSSREASLEACRILARVQTALSDKYQGNTNAKGYKKDAFTWMNAAGIKRTQFHKDVTVGKYLLEHGDDLSKKTKTDIYKSITPPKPMSSKKAVVKVDVDQYWRDCERKYQALMDYMGDRADAILAKALAAKD